MPFNVIGVQVDAVSIDDVVRRMEDWIAARDRLHVLSMVNAHTAADSVRTPYFARVLAEADMRLPDGAPIVFIGRMKGHRLPERVEGLELMDRFFARAAERHYRCFFYGAGPGVAESVSQYMTKRFPGSVVAGAYSPPFRELTEEEDKQVVDMINAAAPDVLWVSLGGSGPRGPKEHVWIFEHKHKLRVPVAAGVGQAFDTLGGVKPRLPMWVRRYGFEWLVRMIRERKRLFWRYMKFNALFLGYLAADALGIGPSSRQGSSGPTP